MPSASQSHRTLCPPEFEDSAQTYVNAREGR